MPFPYPPDPGRDVRELFRRHKQRDTVRDQGQVSMSPGDGMLELRDGSGKLIGGYGDLPDGTFGFSIFRNGAVQNINTAFDADFKARDDRITREVSRLDGVDAHIGSRLAQHDSDIAARPTHDVVGGWLQQRDVRMNGLDGQIKRLDAVDASIASQLADRYTKAQIDSAFSSRDGRLDHLDAVDANIGSRLAGHDSSISSLQSQMGDRYTKGQIDSAFDTRDARISAAASAAAGARGAANSAQSSANEAGALAQKAYQLAQAAWDKANSK